eukprot:gene3109-3888_t
MKNLIQRCFKKTRTSYNQIRFYSSKNNNNNNNNNNVNINTSRLDKPYNYKDEFKYSIEHNHQFWDEIATKYVHWNKRYDRVLGGTDEKPEWFQGGMLNACYNALDVHVKDPKTKSQIALISETPAKDVVTKLTYEELWEQVCLLARGLQNLGVTKSDRVVIYTPMIVQPIIAMLACARLGAIHNVVFGGFASPQLAARIDNSKPKVIISANFGIEGHKTINYGPLLSKALELCQHKPEHIIVYDRVDVKPDFPCPKIPGSLDWMELIRPLTPLRDYTIVESTHPLYLIYTSGTTGTPKGLVRETGGYMAALQYTMKKIYGMNPGDVFWSASDVGWVVGHSVSTYGSLLAGVTSVVYEGKPIIPDAGIFWRMVERHRINGIFSAPTAIRAIHKEDPKGLMGSKYDLSSLRSFWLGGEKLDSNTLDFLTKVSGAPVYDNYWQTESGWCMITNPCGAVPIKRNTTGVPVPSYKYEILNSKSEILEEDESGEICIKLPVPPGFANTLYQNHEGFKKAYLDAYPGYLRTGDSGFRDHDGYISVMSRVDDIINVSGHRLSTGSIEEVLSSHPSVVECCVIGVHDDIKGEVPFGCVIIKPSGKSMEEIEKELIKDVREKIGPVATFKKVVALSRLPKTRSGKILRATLRKIYHKEEFKLPPTIEDEEVLKEVAIEFEKFHKTQQ